MRTIAFIKSDNRAQLLDEVLTSNVITQLFNELVMFSVHFSS